MDFMNAHNEITRRIQSHIAQTFTKKVKDPKPVGKGELRFALEDARFSIESIIDNYELSGKLDDPDVERIKKSLKRIVDLQDRGG